MQRGNLLNKHKCKAEAGSFFMLVKLLLAGGMTGFYFHFAALLLLCARSPQRQWTKIMWGGGG